MNEVASSSQDLAARAIAGDPEALRALVGQLAPVVRLRAARALSRTHTVVRQRRCVRQEVDDLVQEVFVTLFDREARALRGWDAARGTPLAGYVAVVADNTIASLLRSGRRRPWRDDVSGDEDDGVQGLASDRPPPEAHAVTRQLCGRLLDRMEAELSPRAMSLFVALVVDERSVADVCRETGMTADAVYAWRSRLGRVARRIGEDLAPAA